MKLFEAFEALDALNEETFAVSDDGVEKLDTFMQDNEDSDDIVDVIDPEAETEEDIQDSYVGKVILDCSVCHSKIYKDKTDVTIDEEQQLANVGEDCPYCYTSDGFKVIGEVAPFADKDEEIDDVKEEEEEVVEESLTEAVGTLEKPMSAFAGTLSNVMTAHQSELANIGSKVEALSFLDSIEPEVKNKGYLATVKEKVAKLPDFKVLTFLYNIILKGDGMGSKLESLTESHRGDRHRVTAELFDILSENGFDTDAEDVEDYVFAARDLVFEEVLADPSKSMREIVEQWFADTKVNYPEDLESLTKFNESKSIKESITEYEVYMDSGLSDEDEFFTDLRQAKRYAKQLVKEYGPKDGNAPAIIKRNNGDPLPDNWEVVYKIYYNLENDSFKEVADGSVLWNQILKQRRINRLKNESKSIKEDVTYSDICQDSPNNLKAELEEIDQTINKLQSEFDKRVLNLQVQKDKINHYLQVEKSLQRLFKDLDLEIQHIIVGRDSTSITVANESSELDSCFRNLGFSEDGHWLYGTIDNVKVDVLPTRHHIDVETSPLLKEGLTLTESKSIREDINNLSLDTDDTHMEMTSDESGKVTITTEPIETAETSDEVIVPVSDETKAEIENNDFENEEDVDFEEFDEASFDELGESYLKESFDNVVAFRTNNVTMSGDDLIIEGLIKFDSGNVKKTSFTFTAKDFLKEGLYRFVGKNNQLVESNSFELVGKIKDTKFICESLTERK